MDEKKVFVPEKTLWVPNTPKIEEVLAKLNGNQPPMLALPPPRS